MHPRFRSVVTSLAAVDTGGLPNDITWERNVAKRLVCRQCDKSFRGAGGLDWHRKRSGHLEPGEEETTIILDSDPVGQMNAIADTVDELERQVEDATKLYNIYSRLGTAPHAPQALVERVYGLADRLESTRI